MRIPQVPTVLVLALAMAAFAAGCAGDGTVAPTTTLADVAAHGQVEDAHAHDAGHALAGSGFPVPEGHVRWTPDAPLLEGMSRVRAAIDGLEQAAGAGAVAAQAAEVDAAVDYMFANCRLDPEPDIALHAVLAQLMAASQALQADPADLAPVAGMHAAVANYEALFDDPHG